MVASWAGTVAVAAAGAGVAAVVWCLADRARKDRQRAAELARRCRGLSDGMAHRDRLATVGTLAASVAHDARNSLVSAHTFFQLAPERWEDEEFRSHYAPLVAAEIERARDLLAQLLDLSRAAGARGDVELGELVRETGALLRPRARRCGVELEVKVPCEPVVVLGNATELRQVVVNLVLNAIEASGEGGRVLLAAGPGRAPGAAEIVVSDSGPGIAPGEIETVFERFFTTKPGGTGLGLAVVRDLVQRHGGSVSVARGHPAGAVLTVRLPLRGAQRQAA